MEQLDILLISDPHLAREKSRMERGSETGSVYSLELITRILRRAERENYDALALTGDIADRPSCRDLLLLKEIISSSGIPAIVIPGNHDMNRRIFLSVFREWSEPLEIKGFILYPFWDRADPEGQCFRDPSAMAAFQKRLAANPDRKAVVFQHAVVHPRIKDDYPYNLTNSADIAEFYEKNGVLLSVSGHYHPGNPMDFKGGTAYFTAPALCKEPFPYAAVRIREGKPGAEVFSLQNVPKMADHHCHTQFAYCGRDISVEAVLKRAEIMGIEYICFTEHAPQLYLPGEDYWSYKWVDEPGILERAEEEGKSRMGDFKETVRSADSALARMGLEIEIDSSGNLTVLEKDLGDIDIAIGAIHYINENLLSTSSHKIEKIFMQFTERLVSSGIIDVLAHPFRFFYSKGLRHPVDLYKPLIDMLKDNRVAAELNPLPNNNSPDPDFFRICIEEGVKISLGTDTHSVLMVGEFHHHIKFLRDLGIREEKLPEILFRLSDEDGGKRRKRVSL